MANLREMVAESNAANFINKEFSHGGKSFQVAKADDFEYTDPIDGSVTKKQVSVLSFEVNMNYISNLLSLQTPLMAVR